MALPIHDPYVNDPVVVIGMGAIGTTVAAKIAQTGRRIVACACSPIERITLTDDTGTFTAPVEWLADPKDVPSSRWVLLATKMHHIESASPWLRRAAHPDSRVLVLQNGVEHRERVSPHTIGCIVPALVYINAERLRPGEAKARLTPRDLVLPNDPQASDIVNGLLRGTGLRIEQSDDFLTEAWVKLLTNLTANPITALTTRRVEVMKEPLVEGLALRVLEEAVSVGRAAGANLPVDQARQTISWLQALPEGATSSMLQDRLAGRSLEYDGMTGVVVRLGRLYGIPTPANEGLLALLSALLPGVRLGDL
ncbi:MAG: 2-dehydropantoate 2-reductase [Thermomicrobiales bacterium]